MTSTAPSTPILMALEAAHAALDAGVEEQDGSRRWRSAADLTAAELRQAVALQARLEARVASLKLHLVDAADRARAYEETGAVDAAAWAAQAGGNRSQQWGRMWLTRRLQGGYAATQTALTEGRISEEHAEIIVRAAEKVPAGVTAEQLAVCEVQLVQKAETSTPPRLRKAARRMLEPLSEQLADRHQETLLEDQEREAERRTWLTLHDNHDGTVRGAFLVPELHGHLLRNVLERLRAPRRLSSLAGAANATGAVGAVGAVGAAPGADAAVAADLSSSVGSAGVAVPEGWSESMGAAFLEVLEHLPEEGFSRNGVTLIVTMEESRLRAGLGAARLDTGAEISASEARRLACGAGLLPLVLNGASVPLDLGRAQRLFSRGQALALSAVYDTCAAEGCDRPFAWSELHHLVSWQDGGRTDLANAVPLCGFHHRRIHDTDYSHRRRSDGTIELRRRKRSLPSAYCPSPQASATPSPLHPSPVVRPGSGGPVLPVQRNASEHERIRNGPTDWKLAPRVTREQPRLVEAEAQPP